MTDLYDISLNNTQHKLPVDEQRLREVARRTLAEEQVAEASSVTEQADAAWAERDDDAKHDEALLKWDEAAKNAPTAETLNRGRSSVNESSSQGLCVQWSELGRHPSSHRAATF